MTEYAPIINSDIVKHENDAWWQDSGITDGLQKKPVLILVSAETFNGTEDEEALQRLMRACTLTADDYNVLYLDHEPVAWHMLNSRLAPKVVVLLGVLPAQLGISALFRLNAINHFGGCTWVPALAISTWTEHADMKANMWKDGLKPLLVDKVEGELIK